MDSVGQRERNYRLMPDTERNEPRVCHNIIGCAKYEQSAMLCVMYLQKRHSHPHSKVPPETVKYRLESRPPGDNSYYDAMWPWTIYVDTQEGEIGGDYQTTTLFVDICRAFMAGRGELWA